MPVQGAAIEHFNPLTCIVEGLPACPEPESIVPADVVAAPAGGNISLS